MYVDKQPGVEMPPPSRVAMYLRVSIDRQGNRIGVKTQAEECARWAQERGWQIVDAFDRDNDISAHSRRHRPDWERFLLSVREGAYDGVLAQALDRMVRRVTDLERLIDAIEAAPIPVHIGFVRTGEVDITNATGRMFARVMATVAQAESDQKGERVRSARNREAKAGIAHTLLGYGYALDRSIVPSERDVIFDVRDRLLAGHSLNEIARSLNEQGTPTPGAGRWTYHHVRKVLRSGDDPQLREFVRLVNDRAVARDELLALVSQFVHVAGPSAEMRVAALEDEEWWQERHAYRWDEAFLARVFNYLGVPTGRMYWRAANLRSMIRRGTLCGWREHSPGKRGGSGALVAPGDWQPILTLEDTERIRVLTSHQATGPRGRPSEHLLSGVLRCGICGSKMYGQAGGKAGTPRYTCAKQVGLPERCGGLSIAADRVNGMVTTAVLDLLAESDMIQRTRSKVRSTAPPGAEEALRAIEKHRASLRRYLKSAETGELEADEYLLLKKGLKKQIAELEEVARPDVLQDVRIPPDLPKERARLEEWWEAAPLERRKEVIHALIEEIVIDPVGKGVRRFDASRVRQPKWRV